MEDLAELMSLSVPLVDHIFRGTVIYIALVVVLRIVGQREAGGIGMTDLLVIILGANAASAGMTGVTETVLDGLVLVVVIVLWSVVLDYAGYRWPKFGRLIKASPKQLVNNGRLDRRTMQREFMTADEVISQLRLHGVTDPTAVRIAYIEPNGMVSVIAQNETTETAAPADPPGR